MQLHLNDPCCLLHDQRRERLRVMVIALHHSAHDSVSPTRLIFKHSLVDQNTSCLPKGGDRVLKGSLNLFNLLINDYHLYATNVFTSFI